ncbi:MAG: hypothetical protein K5695_03000 [Oscillospiraceae bacterium]|nr:hypothetical protein [Oscillospiraceae bacterium]
MKSDVISIYSDLKGSIEAIREAEMLSAYHDLDKKQKMFIRLLSEESVSMVHGILNGFKGDFWLESEKTDKGLLCRICVAADVEVDDCQEEALLEVSTSGKNEEAKGVMGKIRELFRWSVQVQADRQITTTWRTSGMLWGMVWFRQIPSIIHTGRFSGIVPMSSKTASRIPRNGTNWRNPSFPGSPMRSRSASGAEEPRSSLRRASELCFLFFAGIISDGAFMSAMR